MRKRVTVIILFILIATAAILIYTLVVKAPLRIGFVADFSPQNTEMAVNGRNAVLMAVDQINTAGGIKGRKIEIIQKNNEGDEEVCKEIIRELIMEGVPLIIGPFLSSMSVAALDILEGSETVIISPLSSAEWLRGKDDNFLAINSSAMDDGRVLAEVMLNRGDRTVALFYSGENLLYTGSVVYGFKKRLYGTGVSVVYEHLYTPEDDLKWVSEFFKAHNPDAILFSTNGRVTAEFLQQYSFFGELPRLYGCHWVANSDVLGLAGSTAEGLILIDDYKGDFPDSLAPDFQEEFTLRYSTSPGEGAAIAYEAVFMIKHGLEAISGSWDPKGFKTAVFEKGVFNGVYQKYRIDSFGDAVREKSLYIIRGGRYEDYAYN